MVSLFVSSEVVSCKLNVKFYVRLVTRCRNSLTGHYHGLMLFNLQQKVAGRKEMNDPPDLF